MSTQHTPGPWFIGNAHDEYNKLIVSQEGVQLAEVICHYEAHELIAKANASLIAAAPDILKVLQEMLRFENVLLIASERLQYPDNFIKAIEDAKEIIKKAQP